MRKVDRFFWACSRCGSRRGGKATMVKSARHGDMKMSSSGSGEGESVQDMCWLLQGDASSKPPAMRGRKLAARSNGRSGQKNVMGGGGKVRLSVL